jgi:hypothetical protein
MRDDLLVQAGAGDPIRAAQWNRIVKALRKGDSSSQMFDSLAGMLERPALLQAAYHSLVLVRNDTDRKLQPFEILGIDDMVHDPNSEWERFINFPLEVVGVEPEIAKHLGNFCVLQETIEADRKGLAVVAGVTPALVEIHSDGQFGTYDYHAFCDVIDGKTILHSYRAAGARILAMEEEGDVRHALVKLI